MFKTNAVEKIETHIYSVIFYGILAVYEIMWKNTVRCIRIACWIPNSTQTHTHTHRISFVFPLQNGFMNASMLRYTCIACLVWFIMDKKFSNIQKLEIHIFKIS